MPRYKISNNLFVNYEKDNDLSLRCWFHIFQLIEYYTSILWYVIKILSKNNFYLNYVYSIYPYFSINTLHTKKKKK